MSTREQAAADLVQRLDQALIWLIRRSREAWDALASSATGQNLGGSGNLAADPGPAVVLMAGGLTTLAALMTLFLVRNSFSSTPDPVNTRSSRKRAQEAVDVYLQDGRAMTDDEDGGSPGAANGAQQARASPVDEAFASRSMLTRQEEKPPRAVVSNGQGSAAIGSLDPEEIEAVDEASGTNGGRSSEPTPFQRGRQAGSGVDASDAEDVLRCLSTHNLGNPSIVRTTPNLYEIRLDGCRGCRPASGNDRRPGSQEGCPFEAGFLEGAMSRFTPGGVVVRETECRRWGDEACAFEVWY